MGKMLCKVCGYAGGPGEAECPQCGAPLWPAEGADAHTPAPTDEVYITTATAAKPKEKKPASPRRTHLCLAAGFLAVCLLVQGLGLWKLTARSLPDWSMVWYGALITPEGIVPMPDDKEPMGSGGRGPRRLFWGYERVPNGWVNSASDQPRTYYYDGETVQTTDWVTALLSWDNHVLFYVTALPEGGQVLYRRDERTGSVQELDRGEWLNVSTSDVSGDALVYVKQTGEDYQVLLWRQGADHPETPTGIPMYLGPGGHSYMAYNYDLFYDQNVGREETWDWAVAWDETGTKEVVVGGSFLVDQDVTELLYQDETGAWRYENAAGEQTRLEGLPQTLRRVLRENEYFDPMGMPVRVTDWIYVGGDGALYYLSKDLTVTNLSGTAAVQNAVVNTEVDQLVYQATEKGEAVTALYRVDDPLSPDRRIVRELAEDDVKAFAVSPDGSAILAKVRPGGTPGATVYKLSVDGGPWQTVGMDPDADSNYFVIDGVQVMNGGGCWYLGKATSLRKTLCYQSPSGEIETKLTWTSLASSTFYPAEPGAINLPASVGVVGVDLMAVSGDQALLRVSADDWIDDDEDEPDARYWLLDKDGSMTELERLEVS